MHQELPARQSVATAIDLYLGRAYPGTIPAAVRARLEQFRDWPEPWSNCPALEKDSTDPPEHIALRLGNPFYPHMKLAIEKRCDDQGYLFRADTHDGQIHVEPGSKEHAAFAELVRNNQRLASQIEADWELAGLPTLNGCIKTHLAELAASASAAGSDQPSGDIIHP